MRASLAVEAITAAHRTGLVAGNAIMHTDRGGQYHSTAYRNALKRLEIRQSTSRTGSCLDGAAAESFFAAIEAEIGVEHWPDRASARRDIENWIRHYNQRRLHPALGYKTPGEARIAWQQRMSTTAWAEVVSRIAPTPERSPAYPAPRTCRQNQRPGIAVELVP
jgi:transposase InsO family protein